MILDELSDFPIEKQVEVAVHIINRNYEAASKIVKAVKENPKASMWEIDNIVKGKVPDRYVRTISFDKETMRALEDACLHRQRALLELVEDMVKDWLRKNLYLAAK